MSIMHFIYFSASHKHCGCYGNGKSQNVAPVGDVLWASPVPVYLVL